MELVSKMSVHDCDFLDFGGKCCGRNSYGSVIAYKLSVGSEVVFNSLL